MNFIVESYERYKNQIVINIPLILDIINIIREYAIIDIEEHYFNIANTEQVELIMEHKREEHPFFSCAGLIFKLNIKENILYYHTYGGGGVKFLSYLEFYSSIMQNELRTYLAGKILDVTEDETLDDNIHYNITDPNSDQLISKLYSKIDQFLYDLSKSYLNIQFSNVL